MKVKVFFLGLILTSLAKNVQNAEEVEMILKSDEKINPSTFQPVCAVNNNNQFRLFPNKCMIEYDQETTGTVWQIVVNGNCSVIPQEGYASSGNASSVPQAYASQYNGYNSRYIPTTITTLTGNAHVHPHNMNNYDRYLGLNPALQTHWPSYAPAPSFATVHYNPVPNAPPSTVYDAVPSFAAPQYNSAQQPQTAAQYSQSSTQNVQQQGWPLYNGVPSPVLGNYRPAQEQQPSDNYNQGSASGCEPSPGVEQYYSVQKPQTPPQYSQSSTQNVQQQGWPLHNGLPSPVLGHYRPAQKQQPSGYYVTGTAGQYNPAQQSQVPASYSQSSTSNFQQHVLPMHNVVPAVGFTNTIQNPQPAQPTQQPQQKPPQPNQQPQATLVQPNQQQQIKPQQPNQQPLHTPHIFAN